MKSYVFVNYDNKEMGVKQALKNRAKMRQTESELLESIFRNWKKFDDLIVRLRAGYGAALVEQAILLNCDETGVQSRYGVEKCGVSSSDSEYEDDLKYRWGYL